MNIAAAARGTISIRILMWDVHGGYTDSLVAGTQESVALARYGLPASCTTGIWIFTEAAEIAVRVS